MACFARFDPRAFLENEKRTAANRSRALATLAALAAEPLQNENHDIRLSGVTADHHQHGKNQKSESTPAKVAKAAKAVSPIGAIKGTPWGDAEEERAAIAEYDGGAPRSWSEALARLDPIRPPCDIPAKRWLQFIDDCGRFLDDGWAPRAEVLGWGPFDLFGCDRIKPFARIDRAGLLWLLNGQKFLALAANAATIATASGGRLTFRKCLNEPGRVLAWEFDQYHP